MVAWQKVPYEILLVIDMKVDERLVALSRIMETISKNE